jgi:hypothetical protein
MDYNKSMTENKSTIYIESTIPSYATAWTSRDTIIAGKQAATIKFWKHKRHKYRLVVSDDVITECRKGDPEAARRRLDYINGIEILPKLEGLTELANNYKMLLGIPDRAVADCTHLAYCVLHNVDLLLTWNCTHLGPLAQKKIQAYNDKRGLWTPLLVTPDSITDF